MRMLQALTDIGTDGIKMIVSMGNGMQHSLADYHDLYCH